jgi:hypothetical protein
MSGVINTGSFTKALWPGVNAWWGKAYAEFPTVYDKLFDKYQSVKAYEEDVGISSYGLAQVKPEGQSIAYDIEQQGFITRYIHATYALGFIITKEMFEDDQYAIVGEKRAKGLAFSARQTKEIVAHNIFNKAFAGAGNPTYGDGQVLISNAHPNVAGGTWSNLIGTAADLSEASLEQAFIDIKKFTNDRGLRIAVQPQSLIVPVEMEFEAYRILQSEGRPGTDNNDINAIKSMGKLPGGVTASPYLTDPDAWFIRTNAPEGLKYFERVSDSFDMDNDFDTDNAKFKFRARYSFGATDPRAIYGSPGA